MKKTSILRYALCACMALSLTLANAQKKNPNTSGAAFVDRLLPVPKAGGFKMDGHWVWDGSIIQGEDGKWHMFASAWSKDVPFHPNWVTNSRVVRAVSDTPEGPYTYVEDVLPPRGGNYFDAKMTHNPTIHKHGDTYLLYYTGTTYGAKTPDGPAPRWVSNQARGNQRIGLATSKSVKGPWTRTDKPILDVREDKWDSLLTGNAAPWVEEDGSVLLLYKSATAGKRGLKYGVSKAPHYSGPYERLSDEPIEWMDNKDSSYEDAFIWKEGDTYHMLFKDMGSQLTGEHHAGVHGVSSDGIHWKLADKPRAYSRNVKWDDGTTTKQGSLERVQVLLIDGKPAYIAFATTDGEEPWQRAKDTFTIVVPLKKEKGAK